MAERKPKKAMTEQQLERLAEARKKANQMRLMNQAKRLQTKMDNLKYNGDGTPKEQLEEKQVKENVEEKEVKENVEEEPKVPEEELKQNVEEKQVKEEPEEPEEEVIIKKKAKPKKKQVVIVEQSSSDSDEFEPNQSVLFVKRVTKKKEVKLPELPPQQYTQPQRPPQREPQRPPPKTKQELIYDNMFSGQFLNNNPMNRRF